MERNLSRRLGLNLTSTNFLTSHVGVKSPDCRD
ncbi:uncharacterized protein G2W53_041172 [Senna tora]|uniref:Uncharacterized protein n=1 Tax=Senna tora TaxID=362788 RepID=A0A834SFA6_9FABA|nr:uncharacterized protein G2W53_041172 [Senna tora]